MWADSNMYMEVICADQTPVIIRISAVLKVKPLHVATVELEDVNMSS